MPRSSRQKLHKLSKHSSKEYSDSEEDVVKMKENSKSQGSASAEKRKISTQVLDGKDLSGHGNGEVSEDYGSTKRRKEKSGVNVGSDRWNGGEDKRGDSDSNMDSEMHKGESLRPDTKSRSKRHGTGSDGEKKDDNLMMEREESKSKGGSRRKSERDSSSVRKEGKELKDKERRSEKEKNGGQESKSSDAAVKVVDTDVRKKQGSQSGDFSEERPGKRAREHAERTVKEESQNPELEKEAEIRIPRRREGSSERDRQYDDSIEDDGRLLSSRGDRAKDVKFRDDKLKDGSLADKYQEDGRKDDRRRDEKCRDDADKDKKYQDDKYREDSEKNARKRLNKHHEDCDRDNRWKYEKDRNKGERDYRRKDDKYRQGIEYDDQRVDKFREDGNKNYRRKDGPYVEDAEKDIKYVDERYHDDGDRDDRRRDNYYKDDGNRDHRREEEKYRDDIERQSRHKNSKQGDEFDREKRMKDAKYRDELTSRDRSDEWSDHKRSRDDGYAAGHHSRKLSVYDDSPPPDDRTAKHRDDEVRRRIDEKDDYGDSRSRGTRDQRSDAEKKSSTCARMDQITDRVQNRRQSSPTTSSQRDHYRVQKQDSKYRDYNYEARVRHTISGSGDYSGAVAGFEKTSSSRSLEKIGTKDDDHLACLSTERRLKPDICSSPLRFVDKSPSSSNDRKLFSKPDLRRSVDVEESKRSGGSRDAKEFSGKEGRGSRDLASELLLTEADTLSVSSPLIRSNHFSSSSKSLAPPPLFRGVDSPLLSGSVEDDSRGKSSIRHRRNIDPNMGRIQGNAWRGVPSWPSPVGNSFLPFPHGPPPVSFHSVMHPFPSPPMFGVRPSMDLSHPVAPYLMPGDDRFSVPGRPMGWRHQVDDSCPPLHAWDASNPVFSDESHIYGRSDWDHHRNLPGSGGWGSSDLLGGPNKNATSEMRFSEKGNNSIRSAAEAMADESSLPSKNEPATADQQVKSIEISQSTKNSEKNDVDAPPFTSQEISDVKMMSRTDGVPLFHFYLLKLDISSDITDPECFSKCTGLIDVDQSIYSDVDGAKILCMERAIEGKMTSDKLLNDTMLQSTDNSVLQKSTSLYQRQKQNLLAGNGNELNVTSKVILSLDQEDQSVEDDQTEKLCPIDNMQAVEYAIPMEEDPQESLGIVQTVSNALQKSTEPASSDLVFDQGNLQENNVEEKALSPLPYEVKAVSAEVAIDNKELKLLDTKCGNADVPTEAIMMPELVNLSRIHHSPESTH